MLLVCFSAPGGHLLTVHLRRLFDPQKTGTISFDRFQQLHSFLMNSQQTFDHFDQQRRGEITRQATEQAVRQAGMHPQ